jgi:hypothetical protein
MKRRVPADGVIFACTGDEALDAAGMLSCMFPGFDPDFVHAVLDETGYGFGV